MFLYMVMLYNTFVYIGKYIDSSSKIRTKTVDYETQKLYATMYHKISQHVKHLDSPLF